MAELTKFDELCELLSDELEIYCELLDLEGDNSPEALADLERLGYTSHWDMCETIGYSGFDVATAYYLFDRYHNPSFCNGTRWMCKSLEDAKFKPSPLLKLCHLNSDDWCGARDIYLQLVREYYTVYPLK